jgi:hypothetical protein
MPFSQTEVRRRKTLNNWMERGKYYFTFFPQSWIWAIFHLFCELVYKLRHQLIELVLFYHNMTKLFKEFQLNWIP